MLAVPKNVDEQHITRFAAQLGLGYSAEQPERLGLFRCPPGFTANSIEFLVASDGRQPCTRLVGKAISSPNIGGHDDRIVKGVLGPVDITGQANEGGQHLATLDANDLVEWIDQPISLMSMTGRTSTLPYHAPGICAAHLSASSRSLQSSR